MFRIVLVLLIGVAGCTSDPAPTPAPFADEQQDAPMDVDVVDPDDIPPAPVISAEEALEDFEVEDGFEIQLVAREPEVVDPVALSFDENGAMWVVEMRDYMWTTDGDKSGDPAGRIVVLRDLDDDGFFETSSVFMEGLLLPRALSLYEGGVLVAVPPNLFFVDRNGYEAGAVTVVDSVYAIGENPEHMANGLMVGIDNWIYSARSDVRYRYRNGNWEKEPTEYRGQWGITQDDWGRLFYNHNSTTLQVDDLPPNVVRVNTHRDISSRRLYGEARASSRTYPRRVTPGLNRAYRPGVLDEEGKLVSVTSAAGPVVYRGDQFPAEYHGNAFVQETSVNLVKRVILGEDEGRVTAEEPYTDREFLTATDERFRPVNGYTAPDGSLYILDMYRGVIQHVAYLTDYLRRQIEARGLERPLGLGRIYRVKWTDGALGPKPGLGSASNQELLAHLAHSNGWWRDTAQRLLIERDAREMRSSLESMATGHPDPRTRIHALWTLEGLQLLSTSTLDRARQTTTHPKVLGHIARLAGSLGSSDGLVILENMVRSTSVETARYVAGAAALYLDSDPERVYALSDRLASRHDGSADVHDAIVGPLEDREETFLAWLEASPSNRSLTGAVRHAAGMARVQSLAGERLLSASFEPSFERGRNVYSSFCANCHGQDGRGLVSVAPPLIRSHWVLQNEARLVRLILDGVEGPMDVDGRTYASPEVVDHMPGLRQLSYTDGQIADVLTFVRNEWGNQATGIAGDLVASIREAGTHAPYSAEELKASESGWQSLVKENSLAGWARLNGTAQYTVEGGTITGTTRTATPNTFLATERTYSDFILELQFKVDPEINSGVQIRSNSLPDYSDSRVHGYQIEIDPSERAWTGGLYDEGRRGWIQDLRRNARAREAFRQDEWNHFRIEARGDHIRSWLNGVMATDVLDSMTSEGFIALQVHSVPNERLAGKTVQWRNVRIKEL